MENEAYSAKAIALEEAAAAEAALVLTEPKVVGGLAGFFNGLCCLPVILLI